MIKYTRLFSLASLMLLLSGCASFEKQPLPASITNAPDPDIHIEEVDSSDIGSRVRWGGEILKVKSDDNGAKTITVLEHAITESGKPDYNVDEKRKRQRFEVVTSTEDTHYRRNQFITVYGQIAALQERQLGKKTLTVPVLNAEALVKQPAFRRLQRFPHYYHPHYYYHSYYHPYWRHRFYRHHYYSPFYWW